MSFGQGSGKVEKTAQQRAQLDIANQQIQDWRTRWMPQLQRFSAATDKATLPGSYERRHATAQAGADNSVRFDQAQQKALGLASSNGAVGSAKQKLGITNMGNDEATSTAFGSVAADQAVDDSTIQGNKAIAALARGEKADTLNALGRNAAISGQQAQRDADASLQENAGYAGLAGKIVGTGAGLWMGSPSQPNANLTVDPNGLGINNPYGAGAR